MTSSQKTLTTLRTPKTPKTPKVPTTPTTTTTPTIPAPRKEVVAGVPGQTITRTVVDLMNHFSLRPKMKVMKKRMMMMMMMMMMDEVR